jgi:hypothetical protein
MSDPAMPRRMRGRGERRLGEVLYWLDAPLWPKRSAAGIMPVENPCCRARCHRQRPIGQPQRPCSATQSRSESSGSWPSGGASAASAVPAAEAPS